jgi:hypothetical protein
LVGNPSALSYSPVESPLGFPHWFAFTPTISVSGGTAPTYAGANSIFSNRFCIKGNSCFVAMVWYNEAAGSTAGSGTNEITFTPPVGFSQIGYFGSVISYEGSGGTVSIGMIAYSGTSLRIVKGDAVSIKGNDQSSALRYINGNYIIEI